MRARDPAGMDGTMCTPIAARAPLVIQHRSCTAPWRAHGRGDVQQSTGSTHEQRRLQQQRAAPVGSPSGLGAMAAVSCAQWVQWTRSPVCLAQQRAPAPPGAPCSSGSSGGPDLGRTGCAGAARATRRISTRSTSAIAVPGPLFISENFDRGRLQDSKTSLQPSGNFLQFPSREEGSELRRTPPLVRCARLPAAPSLLLLGCWCCAWRALSSVGRSLRAARARRRACTPSTLHCRWLPLLPLLCARTRVIAQLQLCFRCACHAQALHMPRRSGLLHGATIAAGSGCRRRRRPPRFCCLCRTALTLHTPVLFPCRSVRLAVEYRVHSRQMLCVGGSQIPFGWSFLSIAKVCGCSWDPLLPALLLGWLAAGAAASAAAAAAALRTQRAHALHPAHFETHSVSLMSLSLSHLSPPLSLSHAPCLALSLRPTGARLLEPWGRVGGGGGAARGHEGGVQVRDPGGAGLDHPGDDLSRPQPRRSPPQPAAASP